MGLCTTGEYIPVRQASGFQLVLTAEQNNRRENIVLKQAWLPYISVLSLKK